MIVKSVSDDSFVLFGQSRIIEFNRPPNEYLPLRNGEGGKLIKDLGQAHADDTTLRGR